MKISNLIILIIAIILCACKGRVSSVNMEFPIGMQKEIKSQMTKGKMIIYYHSGECSFCYGTLMAISNEFPDLPLVSISASQNKGLVDYYLEQIQFKGISLIDSTSIFLKSNQKILSTQNIFLINQHYVILAEGIEFDQKTKGKISHAIWR